MKPIDNEHYEDVEPEFELPVDQLGTGDGAKFVLAAGGAALGALAPAVGGPIAVTVAGLEMLRERLQKHQEKKQETVLQAASGQAAIDPADVVRRICESDDLALLAAEVLDAARRTRLRGKPASLGRSLGAILLDDARIDKESIWIRILAVVEPPHIRVLKHFVIGQVMRNGSTYWKPGVNVSVRTVSDRLGLEDAALPLVQDLLRCGLLMNPGGIDGGTPDSVYTPDSLNEELRATWLGAELFTRLESSADEI